MVFVSNQISFIGHGEVTCVNNVKYAIANGADYVVIRSKS